MRAIRVDQFGGEENLKVHNDLPIPKPATDEVLIKVMSAGVNPVDTYIRQGTYPGSAVPYIAGKDAAGIVEEVGADVKNFHKGDRVIAVLSSGSYAEYCTAKVQFTCSLHESVTFEQGASIGIPYYTAYAAAHFKAKVQKGETALVHGASGAVGIAAVQILKAHGCLVIGTAGTPEGLQLVKNQGADFVFNHREENYMKRIKDEVTNGQGVDVILEMLANVNLQADLETMAFRGRTVVVGCRGPIEINPRLLMSNESAVLGIVLAKSSESEWKSMHEALYSGQVNGWLRPFVGRVYKLEEAGKAQFDVINNPGTQGKLVIDVACTA